MTVETTLYRIGDQEIYVLLTHQREEIICEMSGENAFFALVHGEDSAVLRRFLARHFGGKRLQDGERSFIDIQRGPFLAFSRYDPNALPFA